ncbi:MAG TPA: hypothetical protein VLR93_03140 [Patescibacteria group bacterium]|nr:hypothetical protein [Patescibacteria group bacterium]
MTVREAWLTAGFLFVAAVVARAIFAATLRFPTPEDTAYYVGAARNLLEGRGLVSDAIWSFQTPPLVFPRPAFEVWLPLPTVLALPAMAILGHTFEAAKVPAVLVGSLVPVLAWRLAADVAEERGFSPGRARTLAIGTGLTAVVYLPLVLFGALPDSTMPFATLALAAGLLMTRILRRPPLGRALRDPRLLGLGVILGLAALTRNEAAWLALTWVGLAFWSGPRGQRLVLVAIPAVVALLIFAPWAVRDWAVFGNPLPGQALANALSIRGFDIFAWNDPPTLARYLAVGPVRLVEMRVEGIWHNLVNVLVAPGFPVSLIGLVALPWTGRAFALRPLVVVSVVTFLVTSLIFPVATTWGTFLHAAGAVHVLLIVSALLALDALIARVGTIRGWTRPVAWLGPTLTIASGLLFSIGLVGYANQATDVARRYELLADRMAAIGRPLDATAGPVVTDFPIWLAEARRIPTLALPDESPADVVDLAQAFPGTRYLVMSDDDHGSWPGILATDAPGAACFHELDLGPAPTDPADARAFAKTRVFEIGCP